MEHKIKVGILVALRQELSTLTRINLQPGSSHALSNGVEVYLTGMGSANAEKAAKKMIVKGSNVLISWGTAAALNSDLLPGTLCVPEMIITSNMKRISTSFNLRKIIKEQLYDNISIATSPLAESPSMLTSIKDKITLHNLTNAKSADMESSAILEVANKENIPFVAIRAISDTHDMTIPVAVTNASRNGIIDIPTLIAQLSTRPADWIPVIRLALDFRKARQTLRKTAKSLLPIFEKKLLENVR